MCIELSLNNHLQLLEFFLRLSKYLDSQITVHGSIGLPWLFMESSEMQEGRILPHSLVETLQLAMPRLFWPGLIQV